MANEVSVSIARGNDGFKDNDFTVGTSVPGAGNVEVRISDTTALTRKDVILMLEAIIRELRLGTPVSKIKSPVL